MGGTWDNRGLTEHRSAYKCNTMKADLNTILRHNTMEANHGLMISILRHKAHSGHPHPPACRLAL